MMKKMIAFLLAAVMLLSMAACGSSAAPAEGAASAPTSEASQESAAVSEAPAEEAPVEEPAVESAVESAVEAAASATEEAPAESSAEEPAEEPYDGTIMRVGTLKGPTTIGLVSLMDKAEKGESEGNYEFTMDTADVFMTSVVAGDLDLVTIPANVASIWCNKLEGAVTVVDVNTLGVLYMLSADDSITSISDLAGKTIVTTGKGNSPEWVLRYLLTANGVSEDDVTIEYASEATEALALLSSGTAQIGLLPQPFVTAAMMQNDKLRIALDLNNEWSAVSEGSALVTGVTVVRNEVLAQNREMVNIFLEEASHGVKQVNEDPAAAAELIVNMGIVAKAPIAEKAIPYCNLVCITGEEMKTMLSGYLETLYNQNDKAVGGAMPADAFYFVGE